jgi:hypothetical protein
MVSWLFCDEAMEKLRIHNTDSKTARMGGERLPDPLPVVATIDTVKRD